MTTEIVPQTATVDIVESAPTETEVTNTEVETTDSDAVETTEVEGSEPKQSKAVKELISVRKRAQNAEAEVAYYKALAEAGAGNKALPPQAPEAPYDSLQAVPVPPEVKPAPKWEDYEDWDLFEEAKRDHIIAVTEYNLAKRFRENMQQYNASQAEQQFKERIEKVAVENPTIRTLLTDPTLPVSVPMSKIIKASDNAGELLLYLDANRMEAAKIAAMEPILAAVEMGRIKAVIANTPPAHKPKRVSQAPEPVKTVTAAGSPNIDEEKLPVDEWMQRRNQAQYKKK